MPDLLPAPRPGLGTTTRCRRQRSSRATPQGAPGIDHQIQPIPFDVRLEPLPERLLVVPCGELDVHTADRLRAAMQEQFSSGVDHVVADLRELTFIDSSGVRALWQTHTRAEGEGRRLSVIPGDGDVCRALTLTGILERMHLLG